MSAELCDRIQNYLALNPRGGYLAGVLDGFNLCDTWIAEHASDARKHGDNAGAKIARELLGLPYATRRKLFERGWAE